MIGEYHRWDISLPAAVAIFLGIASVAILAPTILWIVKGWRMELMVKFLSDKGFKIDEPGV